MSYITFTEIQTDLGIYEFEIQTTFPTGTEDVGYKAGDTLTGVTSEETMVVSRVINPTKYFVINVSGEFTLGEQLTDGSDTCVLLRSDGNAVQSFINRAQSLIETLSRKKLLNTGTSHTAKLTTKKYKTVYVLPAGKLPIISITSITSDGLAYNGVLDTNYTINTVAGIIDFKDGSQSKDPLRYENLTIVYTYGDASATVANMEAVHKEALLVAVIYMWDRYYQVTTAPGASSINPAGFAMQFKPLQLFTEDYIKLIASDSRWLM